MGVSFCFVLGWVVKRLEHIYIYMSLGQVILGWFGFAEDMNFMLVIVGRVEIDKCTPTRAFFPHDIS